jgi:predicted acylesterase/phospholipase RssA
VNQPVGILYATAGGRYPFMAGVADALEAHLATLGYSVAFRIGASGGSIVASMKASGVNFLDWLSEAATPTNMKAVKIGGTRSLHNIKTYIQGRGFIDSNDLVDLLQRTLPDSPNIQPCYSVSWCVSSEQPVVFRLTPENRASRVAASCALPVGLTSVKIRNGDLESRIQRQLKLEEDPDGFSAFRDGGLCPGFPLDLVEGIKHIPVVVVTIDIRDPGTKEKPISIFQSLLARQVRVKILDNLNEIRSRRSLSVLCVPAPSYINSKFSARFDITEAEGRSMYDTGHTLARTHLFLHPIYLPIAVEVPTPEPIAVEVPAEAGSEQCVQ